MEQEKKGFSGILEDNNKTMKKIKEYENAPISTKVRNVCFIAFVLATLFMIGLFAATIISGIFALFVTGVFCIGSFFAVRFLKTLDPLIKQKTKNLQMEAMVKEARKHSISQLNNQIIENQDRLKGARDSRNKMGALVERLKSQINPENAGTPMYEKKTKILERVSTSYVLIKENVEKAARSFADFEKKVYEFKEMEAFAELANEAMSCFGGSGADKLDEMLSLAAFEQIETDFNGALISIENSAKDMALDQSI